MTAGKWFRHIPTRQLDPVADDVVLKRQHVERVHGFQNLDAALGHGEPIVAEFDLAALVAPFEHRVVDDPAKLEGVGLDKVQFLAYAVAVGGGKLGKIAECTPQTKKTASASFKFNLTRIASVRSGPIFLATGPAPSQSRKMISPNPGWPLS